MTTQRIRYMDEESLESDISLALILESNPKPNLNPK
jgi:hypothetical protein